MSFEIAFGGSSENVDGQLVRDAGQFGVRDIASRRVIASINNLAFEKIIGLQCIFITTDVNEEKSGIARGFEWNRGAKWRYSERDQAYLAFVHLNISPWARSKKVPKECWLSLDTLVDEYERVARLVVAQIAIELGEDLSKIATLVEGTGYSVGEIQAANDKALKKKASAPKKSRFAMDVQVYHGLYDSKGDGRGNLGLREELRIAMEHALKSAKLGRCDGGSSGEEHFEFGFVVSNEKAAEDCIRQVLANAGYADEAVKIEFETL